MRSCARCWPGRWRGRRRARCTRPLPALAALRGGAGRLAPAGRPTTPRWRSTAGTWSSTWCSLVAATARLVADPLARPRLAPALPLRRPAPLPVRVRHADDRGGRDGHRRGRVLYPFYEAAPRISDLSALADQRLGGVIMWVPSGLIPLAASRSSSSAGPPPRRKRPHCSWHRAVCTSLLLRWLDGRRADRRREADATHVRARGRCEVQFMPVGRDRREWMWKARDEEATRSRSPASASSRSPRPCGTRATQILPAATTTRARSPPEVLPPGSWTAGNFCNRPLFPPPRNGLAIMTSRPHEHLRRRHGIRRPRHGRRVR